MAKKRAQPEKKQPPKEEESVATIDTGADAPQVAVTVDSGRSDGPAGLPDAAARLDVLRDGNLEGLEKEGKKVGPDGTGEIKDNLGNDIARHDGPGIADLFKSGSKYGLDGTNRTDPLAGQPQIPKDDGGPETPLKDDPGLASAEPKPYEKPEKGPVDTVLDKIFGEKPDPATAQLDKIKADLGVKPADAGTPVLPDFDEEKKYSDPDQADTTKVEKPAEPPPDAHDLLGYRAGDGTEEPLVPELDPDEVAKIVEAHKGPDPTQIYTNPEELPVQVEFDPANPPRLVGEELENTGDPNDPNAPPPPPGPIAGPGGDQPHTDGEGGKEKGPTIFEVTGRSNSGTKQVDGFSPGPSGGEAVGLDVPSAAPAEGGGDFAAPPPDMHQGPTPGGADLDDGPVPGAG